LDADSREISPKAFTFFSAAPVIALERDIEL
jgi:hypothetical protein